MGPGSGSKMFPILMLTDVMVSHSQPFRHPSFQLDLSSYEVGAWGSACGVGAPSWLGCTCSHFKSSARISNASHSLSQDPTHGKSSLPPTTTKQIQTTNYNYNYIPQMYLYRTMYRHVPCTTMYHSSPNYLSNFILCTNKNQNAKYPCCFYIDHFLFFPMVLLFLALSLILLCKGKWKTKLGFNLYFQHICTWEQDSTYRNTKCIVRKSVKFQSRNNSKILSLLCICT